MKLRYKRQRKLSYMCVGGPWDGKMVLMPHETMKFTIGAYKGFYCKGYWNGL